MRTKLGRLRMRDLAMFVAVAGVVAVAVVLVGRELGLGEQAAAVPETGTNASTEAPSAESSGEQQSEGEPAPASTDLTLTLTAEAVCETGRGNGFSGSVLVYDDGNEIGRKDVFRGWALVAETQVGWSVGGGAGPYRLEVDNETRDGSGVYEGASGTASVSCAPNPGEVFYKDYDQERRYRADPQIDSGPKTIRATVTDATGATAEASVEIYVILQLDNDLYRDSSGRNVRVRLNPGKTYRYNGVLFTVPKWAALEVGGSWEAADGGFGQVLVIVGHDAEVHIDRYGEEIGRHFAQTADLIGADGSSWSFDEYFDEFTGSRGEMPDDGGGQ